MNVLIVVFSALIVIHFVYEAIILPSIQNYLRFKVDALKDKLIFSTISSENRMKPLEFNFIMRSLEINYTHINEITIPLLIKSHKNHNEKIDESFKYENLRSEVNVEQLDYYESKCSRYMFAAFLANSFMYFIYLFPLILVVSLFILLFYKTKTIKNHIVNDLKSGANEFFNKNNHHSGYCYH